MTFNITFKNQDDLSENHRSGFKYIYDNLLPLDDPENGVLLDLYADKSFNWENTETDLPYTRPFFAIVHHTFNVEFSDNNAYNMINSKNFKDSAPYCKGIIVLSEYLKKQMQEHLGRLYMNIPVFYLFHPTEVNVPKFDYTKFINNGNKKIIHIGAWLRNLYFFYNLTLSKYPLSYKNAFFSPRLESLQKVALRGNAMDNYFHSDTFINTLKSISPRLGNTLTISRGNCCEDTEYNKWYTQFRSFINSMERSVSVINRLNNHQYDDLLTNNIVFINLIDASACNTLIECAVRHTPIIVNRHPAVVEVLGERYPLYYNKDEPNGISTNYFKMNKEIDDLLSVKGIILKAHNYLQKLDKTPFTVEHFITNLKNIISIY